MSRSNIMLLVSVVSYGPLLLIEHPATVMGTPLTIGLLAIQIAALIISLWFRSLDRK